MIATPPKHKKWKNMYPLPYMNSNWVIVYVINDQVVANLLEAIIFRGI